MIMRDHTLLLQQLPASRNLNLRPQIIPLTVRTTLYPTIMCLAHLRKHREYQDFTATTRWRRRCNSGFDNKQKLFFSAGIQKLVERYEKYIAKDGDYVEK
jgi:hypothetical protein